MRHGAEFLAIQAAARARLERALDERQELRQTIFALRQAQSAMHPIVLKRHGLGRARDARAAEARAAAAAASAASASLGAAMQGGGGARRAGGRSRPAPPQQQSLLWQDASARIAEHDGGRLMLWQALQRCRMPTFDEPPPPRRPPSPSPSDEQTGGEGGNGRNGGTKGGKNGGTRLLAPWEVARRDLLREARRRLQADVAVDEALLAALVRFCAPALRSTEGHARAATLPLLAVVAEHADVDDQTYTKLLEQATEVQPPQRSSSKTGGSFGGSHRRGTMPTPQTRVRGEHGGGDTGDSFSFGSGGSFTRDALGDASRGRRSMLARSDSQGLRALEAANQAAGAPPPLSRVGTQHLSSSACCGSGEVASFGPSISSSQPTLQRDIRLA